MQRHEVLFALKLTLIFSRICMICLTNSWEAAATWFLSVATVTVSAVLFFVPPGRRGEWGSVPSSEEPVNTVDLFLCRLCSLKDFCLGVCRLLVFLGHQRQPIKVRVYNDLGSIIELLRIWIWGPIFMWTPSFTGLVQTICLIWNVSDKSCSHIRPHLDAKTHISDTLKPTIWTGD